MDFSTVFATSRNHFKLFLVFFFESSEIMFSICILQDVVICSRVMSLAVELDTGEEVSSVEVKQNVLERGEVIGESYSVGLVD